jgi:hypothetical protein
VVSFWPLTGYAYFTMPLTMACDHGVRWSEIPWNMKSTTPIAERKRNWASARAAGPGRRTPTAAESSTADPSPARG